MEEKMGEKGEEIPLLRNVLNQKDPPDELSRNDSKKSLSDELFVRKIRILPLISVICMIRIRIFGPRELIQN